MIEFKSFVVNFFSEIGRGGGGTKAFRIYLSTSPFTPYFSPRSGGWALTGVMGAYKVLYSTSKVVSDFESKRSNVVCMGRKSGSLSK